jgi:transposase-like protein
MVRAVIRGGLAPRFLGQFWNGTSRILAPTRQFSRMSTILSFRFRFPDDNACWTYLEQTLWPQGPVCPKCDSVGDATRWKPRPHRWQCRCGAQFHVAQGTAIEGTHLPMQSWFLAIHLLATTPGLSSVELARQLHVRQKTAWSMRRRIRQMQAEHGHLVRGIVAAAEEFGGKSSNSWLLILTSPGRTCRRASPTHRRWSQARSGARRSFVNAAWRHPQTR